MKTVLSQIYLTLLFIIIGTSCSDNSADENIRSFKVGKISIDGFTKDNSNETLCRSISLPNEVLSDESENLNFDINYKFEGSTNQYKATLTKYANNWNIVGFDSKNIKENIDWSSFSATIVSCSDEYKLINADGKIYPVNCCAYYDKLLADQKTIDTDINMPGYYSVNSHDNINAILNINFKHANSLITIDEDNIEIYGWIEKYNTIASIRADLNEITDNNGNEAYLSRPIFSKVNSKWQAIIPKDNTLKRLHIRLTNSSNISDQSQWSEEIIIQLPSNGVSLKENNNYHFSLLLSPEKTDISLNGTYNKWDNNEEELITGLEGIHYILSEEGNKNSKWTILTAKGLEAFSDWVNGKDPEDYNFHLDTDAELGADIYMNDMNKWTPIGIIKDNYRYSYSGTFDGKDHKIYGFKFEGSLEFGLFGSVYNGTIKNITMIEPVVIYQNSSNCSFLVGLMQYGEMINCHIIGGNMASRYNAAPLIATLTNSYISDCTVKGTKVSGGNQTSGFIGQIENSHIYRCGTEAIVESKGEYIGLFTGLCYVDENSSGSIICCYAKGQMNQLDDAWGTSTGGFVGASAGNPVYIGCYTSGKVKGIRYIGGFIGASRQSSTILACSYNNNEYSDIKGSIVGVNLATGYSSFLIMKYCTSTSNIPLLGLNNGTNGYQQDITDENYIKGCGYNIKAIEALKILSSQEAQAEWDNFCPEQSFIFDKNKEKKYNLNGVGKDIEGSIWKINNNELSLWWE